MKFILTWFAALAACSTLSAATLPTGFVEEDIGSGWSEAVGLTFGKNRAGDKDRVYVWERTGAVWIVENGVKLATPLIDLREEVGGWRDYGLLGFALDPNFAANGQIYLFYVVDRHHLLNFGTPSYSSTTDAYFAATIGRITRYTCRASDDYRTVDPASRLVLVGETKSTGFPILHESHGTGHLVFGADGTLFAACGDGASYSAIDNGGSAGGAYGNQALADGIITAAENIGAFRCLLPDSLSGKLIRIDPATGNGVPSNPNYQSANPRGARSRTWASGLRNPYRMGLRPGTGSHNPADGNPGVIYVGDVGWNAKESMFVADSPGRNFGWPLYEGMDAHSGYAAVKPASITDPGASRARPVFDWRTNTTARVRVGATVYNMGAAGNPVPGASFGGNASTGGTWYTATDFPATWQNSYFHADYGGGWIRNFRFDANNTPLEVRTFTDNPGPVIFLATHPETGGLYYITWGGVPRRIRYAPAGNQPPIAVARVSPSSGASPLTVQFSGAGSSDPENGALTYSWNFGDGTTSTAANPTKTYTDATLRKFDVTLTVRDSGNLAGTAATSVSINNTPPVVNITSPAAGVTFPISGGTVTQNLAASVSDAQHTSGFTYQWLVTLVHNTHAHSEPPINTATGSIGITPLAPSANDVYYYKITLTVTDPLGASSTAERVLMPAGGTASAPPFVSIGAAPATVGGPFSLPLTFSESVTGLAATDFALTNATATLTGSGLAYTLNVSPTANGLVNISLPAGVCVDSANNGNIASLPVSTYFLAQPNSPPVVTNPGNQSSVRGQSASLQIQASDPNGNTLTYSATGLPAGLGINAGTGLISGTVSTTASATNNATVTVSDGAATTPVSFTWTTTAPSTTAPGLQAEYFGNRSQTGAPRHTRVDDFINFYWPETTSPAPNTPGDEWSVRWTGKVTTPANGGNGSYRFFFDADDGARIYVNGQLILNHWDPAPNTYFHLAATPITLSAGATYDLRVDFQDFFSDALAVLKWQPPSATAADLVPTSALSHATTPDTTPPAATLSAAASSANATFPVAVAFTESVIDLVAADFSVTNGTATSLSGTGASYTLNVTAAAASAVTISLPAGRCTDAAGNPNTASNTVSVNYAPAPDTTPPTVALSSGSPSTVTGPFPAEANFSEAVLNLVAGDFVVTNGALSAFTAASATRYTFSITPTAAGDVTVSLPAGRCNDAAGNGNTASNVLTRTYTTASAQPGLRGEYFANTSLSGSPVLTRVDSEINTYWPETTSPGAGVPGDNFSVRWTGQIRPQFSETYTFSMDADDGVRLYVNGQLILNHWNPTPNTYFGLQGGPITLTANQLYDLRVEFQDFFSDAYIVLRWRSASQAEQVVPATRLFQPPGPANGSIVSAPETLSSPALASRPRTGLALIQETLRFAREEDGSASLTFHRPKEGSFALETSVDLREWSLVREDDSWTIVDGGDGGEEVRVPGVLKPRQERQAFYRVRGE